MRRGPKKGNKTGGIIRRGPKTSREKKETGWGREIGKERKIETI